MADSAAQLLDPPATELEDPRVGEDGDAIAGFRPDEVIAADVLVEEISIDGMCGVY
jgi:mycofactocin precursor